MKRPKANEHLAWTGTIMSEFLLKTFQMAARPSYWTLLRNRTETRRDPRYDHKVEIVPPNNQWRPCSGLDDFEKEDWS